MESKNEYVTIGDLLNAVVVNEYTTDVITEAILSNEDVGWLSIHELISKTHKTELDSSILDSLRKLTFNINVLLHNLLDGNVEQYGYDYFTSEYNIRRMADSDSEVAHYEIKHSANFSIDTDDLNKVSAKHPSFIFIMSTLNKIIKSNNRGQLLSDYNFESVPELYNPHDVIDLMAKMLDKNYPDIKYYHVKHLTGEYLQVNEVAIVNNYETGATLRPNIMVDPSTIRLESESPKERKGYNLLSFLLNNLI